jgi:putative lipoic acid-binding regulatory protein
MQSTEESKRLLNEHYKWPAVFAFKFIVPKDKSEELRSLLPECVKMETRPSSAGNYHGYTFHIAVGSADEVLEIYSRVRAIKGVIAL